MKPEKRVLCCIVASSIGIAAATAAAISTHNKYDLKVPNGLAFAEFKGYEEWPVIAISRNGDRISVIVGNRVMINAYKSGIPTNGKPFPDGSKMAKIHWNPKTQETEPGQPTVPGALHDVDFMVKDSKRFGNGGGWGWAAFEYDDSSSSFRPGTLADNPPQGNDAKCGLACHTIVKARDFVFTDYAQR